MHQIDEVRGAFAISDIESSPLEMKGPVYTSCVRRHVVYGSVSMTLLAGLKFERADMQMVRWMCIAFRRTSEELRKLVGVEPITTVIRNSIR